MWRRWIGVCARSKMYIPLVFMLLVWCRTVGCVSSLWDAALLALLCCLACRGWVAEGQLKKRVLVVGVLFRNYLACLVEGLDVELLERE